MRENDITPFIYSAVPVIVFIHTSQANHVKNAFHFLSFTQFLNYTTVKSFKDLPFLLLILKSYAILKPQSNLTLWVQIKSLNFPHNYRKSNQAPLNSMSRNNYYCIYSCSKDFHREWSPLSRTSKALLPLSSWFWKRTDIRITDSSPRPIEAHIKRKES